MGSAGPTSEDTEKEVEKRTDASKGGWTPDAGKEGNERRKAPQNAYQGGGKPAGAAGGTQSSN